jgi:hypothetical protein
VLVILGVLFVGLSYLTGEKLNLQKSSYVYWILGMSFFLLTIIGIEFFGIFGSFFDLHLIASNIARYSVRLFDV